ncbi:hypothetical protein WJX82_006268 [Trebouxia sp. C0006]
MANFSSHVFRVASWTTLQCQLQKAALHLLWSWTPSWIQTVCAILAFLRHNTGKQSPADPPPETASFGFGKYIVIIARRSKPCPSGLPPSSSSTVVEPEAALDVASEVEAQKDADNEDGINAHDARTSVVPEEVPEEVPGSCAGSVQGNSGAPMRVPGSGLRATSGKLVVGLFQSMEGAQQRQPLFGFTIPAPEMVTPFWELTNVEPNTPHITCKPAETSQDYLSV